MTVSQRFSSLKDVTYIKNRDREKHQLYYQPRVWLVNVDSISLNIYGEPGDSVENSDGITSLPGSRTFTSTFSSFISSGVLPGDILEVYDVPPNDGDNGRYIVESVVDENNLLIDSNWPAGEIEDLRFRVLMSKERFVAHPNLVPFLVHLNPTEKQLNTWGINERRDAMVELSREVFDLEGLVPKIGDRFIMPYDDRNIHYKLTNLFEQDQLSDSAKSLHYICFAMRTTNRLP